jgi:branched-chain amino acid transport system permease protein
MAATVDSHRPSGLRRLISFPVVFTALALLVFFFYEVVLGKLVLPVQEFVGGWFPLSGINQCLIWAMLAVGLNIVVGYAGLLDLGYVAFWAIGGYVAGWIMSPFFAQWQFNLFGTSAPGFASGIHVNFWLVLPIAAAFCAMWGVIIGAPTLRLKSDYLALVTLGFGEIAIEFFRNGDDVFGFNLTNSSRAITPLDPIPLGFLSAIPGVPDRLGPFDSSYKFLVYSLLAAFAIFVSLRIRVGRLGRAWLAIREDELAASMMGVPLMRTKLAAYAVGAALGGIGGVAYATLANTVNADDFQFANSIILLAMVVLGGMGNVWGVFIGALVLEWINAIGLAQFGSTFNSTFGTEVNFPSYNFLIFGSLLILMMLFRREGLLPEARTKRVLQEPDRAAADSLGADLEGTDLEGTDLEGTSV